MALPTEDQFKLVDKYKMLSLVFVCMVVIWFLANKLVSYYDERHAADEAEKKELKEQIKMLLFQDVYRKSQNMEQSTRISNDTTYYEKR